MCDRITYCDVCECAECPRYGDDCDGDKRNDDLISRADAIEAVEAVRELLSVEAHCAITERISALPSAETSTNKQKHQLSAETPTNIISREDAMGAVQDHFNADGFKGYDDGQKMMDRIKALPSAETVSFEDAMQIRNTILFKEYLRGRRDAVQGWRTGKPKENGDYMVTLDAWGHRYIAIMHYSKPQMPNREVKGTCWYRYDDEWGDVVYDDKDILAWMPLPKPYKGGDDK